MLLHYLHSTHAGTEASHVVPVWAHARHFSGVSRRARSPTAQLTAAAHQKSHLKLAIQWATFEKSKIWTYLDIKELCSKVP